MLKFNYEWSEFEVKRAKLMQDTFEEVFHNLGGEPVGIKLEMEQIYGVLVPGRIIQEVSITRMGNNPSTSVTNKFNQMHDIYF